MATAKREAKKERSREARAARQKAARRKRSVKMVAVVLVVAAIALGLALFNSNKAVAGCPETNGSSSRRIDFTKVQPDCIDEGKKYSATFDTTEGKIVVALDTQKTPKTTNNFVTLSRYHYYDGTAMFRTDPTIDIVQGGSPHSQDASDKGPGYNIPDEGNDYKYSEGDLVMARGPKGGAAQYFFSTGPKTAGLSGEYVTFGKTTEGLDVLKKIMALHQGGDASGSPSKPVNVTSVTIAES